MGYMGSTVNKSYTKWKIPTFRGLPCAQVRFLHEARREKGGHGEKQRRSKFDQNWMLLKSWVTILRPPKLQSLIPL